MERVYSGKSDKENYKNMTIYSDGSRIYFNDLRPNEELNRVFSECWNSLPDEKKKEINKKISERRRKHDGDGNVSRCV